MTENSNIPAHLRATNGLASIGGNLTANMDLKGIVGIFRRRAQLIIGVTVACAMLGLVISLFLTPRYKAEAVMMLNARQTHIISPENAVTSGLPIDSSSLRSEIDIMTSRTVADRVIDKLKLTSDPEFYQKAEPSPFNPLHWFDKKQTEEDVTVRERTLTAQALASRLRVSNDGRSLTIRVTFESKDPQKAAQIANAFADEYLVDQLEAKYDAASRVNNWLSERLEALKHQVGITEKAVEDFREKAKLIEVGGSTVVSSQMEEVSKQLVEARAVTAQNEARVHSANNMLHNGGIDAAADVLSSPLIQRLREQEAEIRRNEADLATRYGEMHPKMIHVRAEYKDLQAKIAEEVQKIIMGLSNEVEISRAKQNQLEKQLVELQAKAGTELGESVTLRQLEREAAANRTLYENFLNRFKQTGEQQELQAADSRILAHAETPVARSFPSKYLFLLVGGILGGIAGVLLAYLAEYFDRGFRGMPQLEQVTGMSAIGLVPSIDKGVNMTPESYVLQKPLSAFSEALRTVRTAIQFSNVDHPPKTVMITSSLPSEGKTTFSLCMARSLAKAGNKILLIDADMRRPCIATLMRSEKSTKGNLASLLSGKNTLKESIEHDPDFPALHYIAARGKTPNAQDLLGSKNMARLIKETSEHYDLVIIDTPPILAFSDAAMVSRVVDTTVFIVRWAETPRETVVRALKQLSTFNCKVAGVVLNRVDLEEHAKYGYNDAGHYYSRYQEYYTN